MRMIRLGGTDVRSVRIAADGRILAAVVSVFPATFAVYRYDLAADTPLGVGPRFPDHPVLTCGNADFTRWAGPHGGFGLGTVGVIDAAGRTAVFRAPQDDASTELSAITMSADGAWAFAGMLYRDVLGIRQRQNVLCWHAGRAFGATGDETSTTFAEMSPARIKVRGDAAVTALALAPEGRALAVGTEAGAIYLRALPSREAVAEFEIPFGLPSQRAVRGLEINAGVLVAWTDTGAAAWELETHDPLWRYAPGHAVAGAAVAADGSAAVAGEDAGLILLDTRGGVRSRIPVPVGDVLSVGFSPDGLTASCGGEDGAVAVVDVY